MGNAVVRGELNALRVDHDHAHLGRSRAHEDGHDHAVDGDRFTGSGRSADEKMGHGSKVADNAVTFDVLADRDLQGTLGSVFEHVAQKHRFPGFIGNLDTDVVGARNRREDANPRSGEGKRDVVGEVGDAVDAHAGRQVDLEQGYGRTGNPANHFGGNAEIRKGFLQKGPRRAQRGLAFLGGALGRRGVEQSPIGKLESFERFRSGDIGRLLLFRCGVKDLRFTAIRFVMAGTELTRHLHSALSGCVIDAGFFPQFTTRTALAGFGCRGIEYLSFGSGMRLPRTEDVRRLSRGVFKALVDASGLLRSLDARRRESREVGEGIFLVVDLVAIAQLLNDRGNGEADYQQRDDHKANHENQRYGETEQLQQRPADPGTEVAPVDDEELLDEQTVWIDFSPRGEQGRSRQERQEEQSETDSDTRRHHFTLEAHEKRSCQNEQEERKHVGADAQAIAKGKRQSAGDDAVRADEIHREQGNPDDDHDDCRDIAFGAVIQQRSRLMSLPLDRAWFSRG